MDPMLALYFHDYWLLWSPLSWTISRTWSIPSPNAVIPNPDQQISRAKDSQGFPAFSVRISCWELGDSRSNPFLKCHRLPLFLSFSIQMISFCCILFGQFLVPKWLLVIIQHDFCQGFLGRGFPKFLTLPFWKLVHLYIQLWTGNFDQFPKI